jgi:hypothetical protein
VLVGWEGNCEYHDSAGSSSSFSQSSAGMSSPENDANGLAALSAEDRESLHVEARRLDEESRDLNSMGRREATGSSRRRTARGVCWHLRNSWGEDWADQGYFRMYHMVLTGSAGSSQSLHIASAAADGPKSVD